MIVNPAAGKSGYTQGFAEALCKLDNEGFIVTPRFTRQHGDAVRLASEYSRHNDIIGCIGGDGTLSEVISGLMRIPKEDRRPIAYIPMGTANDVATTLGIPKNDCLAAVNRILKGIPYPYDVGGFGDEFFAYVAAFGAFTDVSYETPQEMKKTLGHLAYVFQGAAALPSIRPVHAKVEYDGGVIEDDFIYGGMSNSTSVAGIVKFRPEMVSLGDGISELVLVKNPPDPVSMAEMVNSVLTQKFDNEYLKIFHTTKAKFSFDKPVKWTRDGESGGKFEEIELRNYPHPIELIF